MSVKGSILLRTRIVFAVAIVVALVLGARIVYLQHIDERHWTQSTSDAMQRHIPIPAHRGNIYAAEGSLLATSLPFYRLAIDPTLPHELLLRTALDSLCLKLAAFFGEHTPEAYKKKILLARKQQKRYLLLSTKDISHKEKKTLETWPLVRTGRLTGGIIFQKVEKRFRPFHPLAYRTIGYVDWEQKGVVGLERSFDDVLNGKEGRVLIERSSGRRWYPVYDGSEIDPKHGQHIQTTLDINMQDMVQQALLETLRQHDAEYGVAVVMEVKTGEIKAMANLSRREAGVYGADYNYALGSQGAVEPGSTFKLATLLALLERSKARLEDTVQTGDGSFHLYEEVMRDAIQGGLGAITMREAFERSSNIGVAKLVLQHFGANPARYTAYLRSIRLHEVLGVQIKGESRPYIKTPADSTWSGTSLAWMSHGYELKMSPMQMLVLYNAIANQGKMITPLLVSAVLDGARVKRRYTSRVIHESIASPQTIQQVQSVLEGVVMQGTAKGIRSPYYRLAGKTGTAKKYTDGRYVDAYYTSFAGYFPANNPRYSCIVVVDTPRKGDIYGANVAAPLFKQIADYICMHRLLVRPLPSDRATNFPVIKGGHRQELQMLCRVLGVPYHPQEKGEWVKTSVSDKAVQWTPLPLTKQQIPDVRGLTLRDALYLLENAQLKPVYKGRAGRVLHQSPRPGTKYSKGHTVVLTVQ